MVYLWACTNAAALYFAWKQSHDLLSPGVLFVLPWLMAGLMLIGSSANNNPQSVTWLFLSAGTVLFEICFLSSSRNSPRRTGIRPLLPGARLKTGWYKLMVWGCIGITAVIVCRQIGFIVSHFGINLFTSYYDNQAGASELAGIGYLRNIVTALCVASVILMPSLDQKQKQQVRGYTIVLIICAVVCGLLTFTRNGILQKLLPILIAVMVACQMSSRRIAKFFAAAFIAFIGLFAYVAFSKFYYLIAMADTNWSFLWNQLMIYGAGPLAAFQNFFDAGSPDYLYGGNTFRFLLAVWDALTGSQLAPLLVQPYTYIGSHLNVNVYTFFQYYMMDFGWVYALAAECLAGWLHGVLYKQMCQGRPLGSYFFCLMMYPLLMQFFQDQYFSLFSTWLQYGIIGAVFFKTDLLFRYTIRKPTDLSDSQQTGKRVIVRKENPAAIPSANAAETEA